MSRRAIFPAGARRRYEALVFGEIGGKRIETIDSVQVLKVLESIWIENPDTARRILQWIGTVLDCAYIKGMIPTERSLRSVTQGLRRQARQVKHRAALPYADVPISADVGAARADYRADRMGAAPAFKLLGRLRAEHEALGELRSDRLLFTSGREVRPLSG